MIKIKNSIFCKIIILLMFMLQACTYDSVTFTNNTGVTNVIILHEKNDELPSKDEQLPLCLNDKINIDGKEKTCFLIEDNSKMEIALKKNFSKNFSYFPIQDCEELSAPSDDNLYDRYASLEIGPYIDFEKVHEVKADPHFSFNNENKENKITSYEKNKQKQSKRPIIKDGKLYVRLTLFDKKGCNINKNLTYKLDKKCSKERSNIILTLKECINKSCPQNVNITQDHAVYLGEIDPSVAKCPGDINFKINNDAECKALHPNPNIAGIHLCEETEYVEVK